jgi:dipeptidyl aminopeptidase/acylaminoacyl peptidase
VAESRIRRFILPAAIVLASSLIAFGVIFLVMRGVMRGAQPGGTPSQGGQPQATAPPGSTPPSAPPGLGSTNTAIGTTIPASGGAGAKVQIPDHGPPPASKTLTGPAKGPQVAFIYRGRLTVADGDGKNARAVADWSGGQGASFRLSPDGLSIAYTVPDPKAPRLWLYAGRVGSKCARIVDVGPATAFAWSPDGKTLAATEAQMSGNQLRDLKLAAFTVVSPGGSFVGPGGGRIVFQYEGERPAFSPDGSRLAFLRPLGAAQELWVSSAGGNSPIAIAPGQNMSAVAWIDSRTLAAVKLGAGNAPDQLLRMRSDGTQVKVLDTTGGDPLRSFHIVLAGGRGGRMAYDLVGDDGYSRLRTIGSDGEARREVEGARDTYPLSWDLTGSRLFYVEGNASQGEPTVLVSVDPFCGGKVFAVTDAGL